ncbi:MAG: GntR family transcriptional regulator [Acidimicrobiales bacterium]
MSTSSPLDRSGPEPLWAQLAADLGRRLETGEFDDRFPTDLELTKRYRVSRHTVREAVRHLNRDGLLRRERGRGTVVDRSEFEQRLGTVYSLFASIEAQGVEQTSAVLSMGVITDADVATTLGIDAADELIRLERLRSAGSTPLAIDTAFLRADVARPLLDADFSHTALYDELERRCGCRPTQGWERIAPVVPSGRERELLGIGSTDAAFRIERLGTDGEKAIEWRITLIRGDRYRFVTDWSAVDRGAIRLAAIDDE